MTNEKWSWNSTEQKAFDVLKESIIKNVSNSYYETQKGAERIVDVGGRSCCHYNTIAKLCYCLCKQDIEFCSKKILTD